MAGTAQSRAAVTDGACRTRAVASGTA